MTGGSSPAGEQRSAVDADRRGTGHRAFDASQLARSEWRVECGAGAAPQHDGVGPAFRPGPGGRDLPTSPRERSAADGARHSKKNCGHLLGTPEMRFRLIEDHRLIWPVRVMCDALSASPSGYYLWRSRPESPRKIAHRELLGDIQRIHAHHRGRYGAPRIHAELRAEGQAVSRKRIERVMRRHGIRAQAPRRDRVCTTDSKHSLPVAPNLLAQNFIADRPNRVWLADITDIATGEGWLYLAVILDLFTRKGTLKTELVHQREYPDRDTARRDLFAYIEGSYNRQRIHSAIGYITPEQAEAKSA